MSYKDEKPCEENILPNKLESVGFISYESVNFYMDTHTYIHT
jgi:hypothetical protein